VKRKEYLKKARLLREYGFNVGYGKRGKTGASYKSQVTKHYEKIKNYIEGEKQKFVFQSLSENDRRLVALSSSKRQLTPKGIFIRVPTGVRRPPRIRVGSSGQIVYSAFSRKGSSIREEIHPIDPILLAEDHEKAIDSVLEGKEKPDDIGLTIGLTVHGHDSVSTEDLEIEELFRYLVYDLIPRLKDPNISPEQKRKHGKKPLTDDQIRDIFHLKFSYYGKPAKKRKAKRRGKNRRR